MQTFVLRVLALVTCLGGVNASAQVTSIASGDVVAGELFDAAQVDEYGFDVAPGARVFVERLASSNTNGLRWSLRDRVGRVIAENTTSLGHLGPAPLLGGRYVLAVESDAGGIGSYSFRVVEPLAQQFSTSFGTVNDGAFTLPGEVHGYGFVAAGGERLVLDLLSTSAWTLVNWELVDGDGDVVLARTTSVADAGPFVMEAGVYNLRLQTEGAALADYSFALQTGTSASETLALNTEAAAVLNAGDQRHYAVDVPTPTTLLFDVLAVTNSGRLNMRLVAPNGREVVPWSTSLQDVGPLPVTAGSYTLSLRQEGAYVGDASFVLRSVAAPTTSAMTLGTTVQGDLPAAGDVRSYTFSTSGAKVFVDTLSSSNGTRLNWSLSSSGGRVIRARTTSFGDGGPYELLAGDYVLRVEGEGDATGSYEFVVHEVVDVESTLAVGDSVVGDCDVPGKEHRYALNVPVGQQVTLDVTASSNAGRLGFVVEDAFGRVVLSETPSLTSQSLGLLGGDYIVRVVPEADQLGTFAFTVVDDGLQPITSVATPLALDVEAAGSIDVEGEVDTYALTLATPTSVLLDHATTSTSFRWSLRDAAGRAVFTNLNMGYDADVDVLAPGTYEVDVWRNGGTGAYALTAVAVADEGPTAVALDVETSSTFTTEGGEHLYDVVVPAGGANVYFDITASGTGNLWSLVDERGQVVFAEAAANLLTHDKGPYALLEGSYRLRFAPRRDTTPSYSFVARQVAHDVEAIAVNTPVTGQLTVPGQTRTFPFSLPDDSWVTFDVDAGATNLRWSARHINGASVFALRNMRITADSVGPMHLPAGDYEVVLDPNYDATPAYAFTVQVGTELDQVLQLDDVVSDTFASPGDVHTYRWTLATPTEVYLDNQQASPNVGWTLSDATGHVWASRNTLSSVDWDVGPLTLPAGDYKLSLDPYAGVTSSYQFQLASVVHEHRGTLAPDTTVQAQVAGPGSTVSYDLETDYDGQTVVFEVLSSSAQSQWSVEDAVGHPLFSSQWATNNGQDRGPFPLVDGTYGIQVDPVAGGTNPMTFRVVDTGATLAVGEGCAECQAIDLVFVFDNSSSMTGFETELCDLADEMIAGLSARGVPVTATYWGIWNTDRIPCVTDSVRNVLGTSLPNAPLPELEEMGTCAGSVGGELEEWALASAIVAERKDWQEDAVRLVVPLSDEGPYCGSGYDALDDAALDFASSVLQANNVVASPVFPPDVADDLMLYAFDLADTTGGVAVRADFSPDQVLAQITNVANQACASSVARVPELRDLSIQDGDVLPAGETVMVSGRFVAVNHLRPITDVRIGGHSAVTVDAAGHFFVPLVVDLGENVLDIEGVESCGTTPSTVTVTGVADGVSSFANLQQVAADDVDVRFVDSSFQRGGRQLWVDAIVENAAGARLPGPLLMAVHMKGSPAVGFANPVGFTDDGAPYVDVFDGAGLGAGDVAAPVPLVFDNAGLAAVDFDVSFWAPLNRAPAFSSAPHAQAFVDEAWAYTAVATDVDGDALDVSLAVAPTTMTMASGTLQWTPSAADIGTHDVVVVAADGRGASATQTFALEVLAQRPNRPPLFTSSPPTHASIGALWTYTAEASDPDGGDVTFSLEAGPASMSMSTSGEAVWPLAVAGHHVVRIAAVDADGARAEQSFTLTVGEVSANPAAPLITSLPPTTAAPNRLYVYPLVAYDDDEDVLFFQVEDGPDGMDIDLLGRVTWVPGAADVGVHSATVSVVDGRGGVAMQTWDIDVVVDPNLAPVFSSHPGDAVVVGQAYGYAPLVDDPEAEAVAFALPVAPAGASVDGATGEVTWAPAAGDAGVHPFVLTATDASGAVAQQAWRVDVRASNAAPVFAAIPADAQLYVGGTYVVDLDALDVDGDTAQFFTSAAPAGVEVLRFAGLLTWTPTAAQEGMHVLEVEARDRFGASTFASWSVDVVLDDTAPDVQWSAGRTEGCVGRPLELCVDATDDQSEPTLALTVDGIGVSLDAFGCGQVLLQDVGDVEVVATAADAANNAAEDRRALPFVDCNDGAAPVVTLVSPAAGSVVDTVTDLVVDIEDDSPQDLTWEVRLAPVGVDDWRLIGEGDGAVASAAVATLDPRLMADGVVRVQVVGSDGFQTGGIEFRLSVAGESKVGAYSVSFSDLSLRVGGLPMSVTRTYRSFNQEPGDFGVGWQLGLNASVMDSHDEVAGDDIVGLLGDEAFTRTSRVYVTKPNGERVGFTFTPENTGFPTPMNHKPSFTPDDGVDDELEAVGSDAIMDYGGRFFVFAIPYNPDTYILTTPEGVKYTISEEVGLLRAEDVFGNTVDVTDDGVVSSVGVSLSYVRDADGRIVEIHEPAPDGEPAPTLRYAYDALGNLTSFTNEVGLTVEYFYEDVRHPHLLTRINDPSGASPLRNVYDDGGLLIATCPEAGDINTLEGCTAYDHDPGAGLTTMTDGRGNVVEYVYDERGRKLAERRFTSDVDVLEWVYTYDAHGNRLTETDPEGGTWTFTYDDKGRETSKTDPSGLRTWRQTWHATCDERTEICDPDGNCTQTAYNDGCKPVREVNAVGGERTWTYNAGGNLIEESTTGGMHRTYTHNAKGQRETMTDEFGNVETYAYDLYGEVVSRTDRRGQTITRVYDDAHRLVEEVWEGDVDRTTTLTWGANGKLERAEDPDSVLTFTHWPDGRVKTTTQQGRPTDPALTLAYAPTVDALVSGYDGNGNVVAIADSTGAVTTYGYDALDRLTSASQAGTAAAKSAHLTWSAAGALTGVTRSSSVDGSVVVSSTTFGYECAGCRHRQSSIEHRDASDAVLLSWGLQRNGVGVVTHIDDGSGPEDWAVDGANRLTEAPNPDGGVDAFAYDRTGNLTSSTGAGTYTYSWQSGPGGQRLMSTDDFEFVYDAAGNLVERTHVPTTTTLALTYDHRGRMTSAVVVDVNDVELARATYRYNSGDQLVYVDEGNGGRHLFYEGENLHVVTDDAGVVLTRRLNTRTVDDVLAEERGGDTRWLLRDQVGSVRAVVNGAGEVVAGHDYTAFGAPSSTSAPAQEWAPTFASRETSAVSGMTYVRARWFDPVVGRFAQEDPIQNYDYIYSNNAPHTFTDPTGKLTALEYAIILCDISGTVIGFYGIYSNVAAVLAVAANGLEGQPVDAAAARKAALDAAWAGVTLVSPCGLPIPNPLK